MKIFKFFKDLFKEYVDRSPLPPANSRPLFHLNEAGGLDPTSDYNFDRSQASDLITLPVYVQGANCSNCRDFHPDEDGSLGGHCHHYRLYGIQVNSRMLCNNWNQHGSIRSWEKSS